MNITPPLPKNPTLRCCTCGFASKAQPTSPILCGTCGGFRVVWVSPPKIARPKIRGAHLDRSKLTPWPDFDY